MIALLLKELNDAEYIPDEQKMVYEAVFKGFGMTPVEFSRLVARAKRVTHEKGHNLITHGTTHHTIHLLLTGKLAVIKDEHVIGCVSKNEFAGEMAFIRWQNVIKRNKELASPSSHSPMITFSVPTVYVPFTAAWGNKLSQHPSAAAVDGDAAISTTLAPASGRVHDQNEKKKALTEKLQKEVVGSADVVCDEDCTMYTWDFEALHELFEDDPKIRMVFEQCISFGLNQKITSKNYRENNNRYRHLLKGALLGGHVTAEAREQLAQFRIHRTIAISDHEAMLEDLGWSLDAFEAGSKG